MNGVKVCGVTRRSDAELAASLGASAIGVVLAPSPRQVSPEAAERVLAGLPEGVARVGVFVDALLDDVLRTVARCGLDTVQLAGSEPSTYGAELASRGLRVLRAVHMGAGRAHAFRDYPAHAFLLDAPPRDGRAGGTGRPFDWRLARSLPWERGRVVLAGGLDAANVAAAVGAVRPAAVDVCSGVEASPGVKDMRKMAAFIVAATEALTRIEAS